MDKAVLSTRGRITIPAKIRKEAGWIAGTKILVELTHYGFLLTEAPTNSKGRQ